MNRSLLAALALLATGCSIPYTDALGAPTQINSCTEDAECSLGAVCTSAQCVGTAVDLSGLILEVRPNSGASYGASTSFIFPLGDALGPQAQAGAAFLARFDTQLPAPVEITGGKVHLGYASTCKLATDSSFPATITFNRVTDFAGFRFDPYAVEATAPTGSLEYTFDASLLPGTYSVYIQPHALPGCESDTPPPVFYPRQDVPRTGLGVDGLQWGVLKPTPLEGDIQIPDGGDLSGWRLDIVEPDGGRVISTTQTLKQGTLAFSVDVRIRYIWFDTTTSPYIRLRPPEGDARPSVYWGLYESLSSGSEVHLSVANLKIDPRTVEIEVQDANHTGVLSSVQIRSIQLSGAVAKNASFAVDITETDKKGSFSTLLPPGKYRIRATPTADPSLAAAEADLEVPALMADEKDNPCFCGHVISLVPKGTLSGRVLTPIGAPLIGAGVETEPSQGASISYWSRVHALDPLLPRGETGLTDGNGGFLLSVDSGRSDLTVRPIDGSGYPWLVRPRVTLPAAGGSVILDDRALPNPAILQGLITDPSSGAAADVVVEGWLPVRESAGVPPGTVIQIGATTTDANGRYKLVLPASISP